MATYHLRLKNDTKSNGQKVSAKGHADYILRTGEENTDLIYAGSQLPSWADGSPQKFFRTADRYEDKGNRRFKELELSLPNELNLAQNLEIVNTFIAKHLSNHYYAFAIHEKAGALSGAKHPHVHIMFSERLIDEVERIKERPAYKYFKRAAKPLKGEKELSLERRREHGAPKDKKWHDKNFLLQIRADFAEIQNEVLEKYGKTIRVDHRTLDAQQAEAEKKGDSFLSNLNLRVPEEYIGIKKSHSQNPFVTDLQKTRVRNFQRFQSFFQDDINQNICKVFEVRELVKQAELSARLFPSLFTANIAKLNNLKRKFSTTRQNIEKAQAEYLLPAELKTLQTFKESLRQIYRLENLQKEIKRPKDSQIKNLAAYEEITGAITQKIATIRNSLQHLEVQRIEKKLQKPCTYKNIALVAHQHFLASLQILEEMEKTSENILSQCYDLEEKSAVEVPEFFSISDLKENLRQQYRALQKQQENSESKLAELRMKVISPSRAMLIAKNIFFNGDLKKLNAEKSKYEKAEKKLDSDFKFYQEQKFILDNTKWENDGEKIQQLYYLTKTKFKLERRQEELKKRKTELEEESKRLDNQCLTNTAKEKIAIIAVSILRKNLPIVQNFEKEKQRLKSIKEKLKQTKIRLNFIAENLAKKKNYYRVLDSANLPRKTLEDENQIVEIIADALRGENYAVQLVARSSGNNLEMEKDWELMSDLDKDEFLHKKIFREL